MKNLTYLLIAIAVVSGCKGKPAKKQIDSADKFKYDTLHSKIKER